MPPDITTFILNLTNLFREKEICTLLLPFIYFLRILGIDLAGAKRETHLIYIWGGVTHEGSEHRPGELP